MQQFIRMPSKWIRDKDVYPLKKLNFVGPEKADRTAALMLYIMILHDMNEVATTRVERGVSNLTYTNFNEISGLSRTKISAGLNILSEQLELITVIRNGRNNLYKVNNFTGENGTWAKMPARKLYDSGRLLMFHNFHLRKDTELNALKLYLLLVAQRDIKTDRATISLDTITEYTGIHRNRIRPARSLLASENWISVQSAKSDNHDYTKTVYEIAHTKY